MTVFITHELRGRDLSNVFEFGDVQVVVPSELQINERGSHQETIIDMIEDALMNFNNQDYLLLSGDPALIAICFTVAALNNNGQVTVLKWDRITERYYPVSINLDVGEELEP